MATCSPSLSLPDISVLTFSVHSAGINRDYEVLTTSSLHKNLLPKLLTNDNAVSVSSLVQFFKTMWHLPPL